MTPSSKAASGISSFSQTKSRTSGKSKYPVLAPAKQHRLDRGWSTRSLADEPIVRLILDGTVVRVRLDRKATSISLLVVIGVREDGQKVLLAIKHEGASYCP
jgi:hypothetical protein